MKNRKKLKGMTLVEIIIAMAVFAVLGVILLGIGQVVDSTTKASSRLNKKMTVQAPYASSKNVYYLKADGTKTSNVNEAAQYYYEVDSEGNPINPKAIENLTDDIQVYFGDKSNPTKVKVQKYKLDAEGKPIKDGDPVDKEAKADMKANKYSTKGLVEDNPLIYDSQGPNANLNFQFVEIQPEPTT
ncbi:MAG: prepilin-type N-terminal cleavage/methylation domain-containing protein [Ruminococcus sp.]|nr:prepilin-type N-terminal cleavage/methylation domain-containing protein [Ruminococcus sp.]